MRDDDLLTSIVLEEACLTIEQLAGACSVTPDWVRLRVEEGLLTTAMGSETEQRFTHRELWRARHMYRLERDFDAAPELAALFADLLEELDHLRGRLRRAGLR